MNVTEAVLNRKSIRRFLPTPVPNEVIRALLEQASRSPSRANFQPWKIYVLNGESMDALKAEVDTTDNEPPGYDLVSPGFSEPHRMARFHFVEQMFAKVGLADQNMHVREEYLESINLEFFGAPAGLFCFIDERMGKAQWTDLGMFLQTFMLLAQEAGLDTCAQEYWAMRSEQVSTFVGAPEELMLVCGMAIGHRDPDAEINTVVSERMPLDDFATFL